MSYVDFKGAKGGGSSSSSATYTPDSLRSADSFEIILGICEGTIDACETFYIGDTPLSNTDGSLNFEDFILKVYPGDEEPTYTITPYLGGASSSKTVNTTLMQNLPIVRTTTSKGLNYIDLRLAFSALYRQTSSGTFTASATFKIEYKPTASETWLPAFGTDGVMTLSGKTTSTYVKEVRFAVPYTEEDTYDLRVTKTSQESDTQYFCVVAWESYQQVVSKSYKWAGTAIAHLKGLASNQFSSLPEFSGIYRLRQIKVPTNYDPETRTYTGTWDGTFKIAWSNNPAWCLYDFVMNDRFGMAAYYPIYLDKYSVYEAAQWCDEIVSDGTPRYTMNMLVSDGRTLREQAQYMAGVFNGIFLDDQDGTAYLRVDKDDEALHLFTPENIVGDFNYSTTDVTSRYNDITVAFNSEEQLWTEDRRRVYDEDDIAANGRITYDFVAVGCTNASQAVRTARYKLITALTETLSVTFATNRLGSQVLPWEVILVADDTLGYALSGRLVSLDVARTTLNLRDPIYLEAGIAYTLSFDHTGSVIERTLVSPQSGYNTTLTVNEALPEGLPEFCAFSVQGEGVGTPKPFRVIKVTEKEGDPDNYEIYAIEINRNKWNDVDNYTDSGEVEYSSLVSPLVVPGPISCTFSEAIDQTDKVFLLIVNPTFDRGAYPYYSQEIEVWSRLAGSSDSFVRRDLRGSDTIVSHPSGRYEFKILGKSLLGGTSELSSVPSFFYSVSSTLTPPATVTGLKIAVVNDTATLTWNRNSEINISHYYLKHSSVLNGATWGQAATLRNNIDAVSLQVPAMAGTYLIKAVNLSGVESTNAGLVTNGTSAITQMNAVEEVAAPAWDGVMEGVVEVNGRLQLASADTLTDWSTLAAVPRLDFGVNGYVEQGVYTFPSPVDLSEVYTSRVSPFLQVEGSNTWNVLSTWSVLKSVERLSGADPSQWTAALEVSISQDMNEWAEFEPVEISDLTARGLLPRLVLTSSASNVTPVVTRASLNIDMPDRVLGFTDVECPAEGTTVVFDPPYKALKGLSFNDQELEAGDRAITVSKGPASFTRRYIDAAGNPVARSFDAVATGYGRVVA